MLTSEHDVAKSAGAECWREVGSRRIRRRRNVRGRVGQVFVGKRDVNKEIVAGAAKSPVGFETGIGMAINLVVADVYGGMIDSAHVSTAKGVPVVADHIARSQLVDR